MNKRKFFLKGLNAGAVKKRHWVNSIMTVVRGQDERFRTPEYPYELVITEDQAHFRDPENGMELTKIDDYVPNEPLFHFLDELVLQPGDMVNYKGPGELSTTYGNAVANQIMLVLPFGDTFSFIPGRIDASEIESMLVKALVDDPLDPDDDTPPPPGKVYVRQYLQFCDHALSLPAYANHVVASVTPKSLAGHPERNKRRQELMEKYKDRLDDPSIIARIGKELGELDMEWLKDDPSYQFYMSEKGKLFDGARKKQFYMFGGESPFEDGTTVEFIHKSLEEGIDTDHMPVLNNSIRSGSYNRGAQTKLGGEQTKTIYRMLGTTRIVEDDCGVRVGIPTKITSYNKKRMSGYYIIDNGQSILLTEANIDQYVGKVVDMRSPLACKTGRDPASGQPGKGKNVCAHCMGTALAEQPNGLPAAAAGVGGRFLTLFLKKMHSNSLKTTQWDFNERIS